MTKSKYFGAANNSLCGFLAEVTYLGEDKPCCVRVRFTDPDGEASGTEWFDSWGRFESYADYVGLIRL